MPVYSGPPSDQQPIDLQGAFAMVDSMLWRDGGLDQMEQQTVMAWIQNFILRAQAAAQQMQQQGGQAPGQEQGLGSSSAGGSSISNRPSNYNPMSGAGGSDIPGDGGDYEA